MESARTASNTMSVGYRTVDGVRVRCAESDGPPDRTVVLTSPWPESVYAFAPIWGAARPAVSSVRRRSARLWCVRASRRSALAARDGRVPRPPRG